MLPFISAAVHSYAASSCPPTGFHTLGKLNATEYTRATWYIQQQQITGYQPLNSLYCVTATYALEGKKVPFSNDTVITVYNYANEGKVNGKHQNSGNSTLCAREVDAKDPSKLAVAPCFLPDSLAGPYWLLAVGIEEGRYTWAIIIGGEPTEQYNDGCTTKTTGINGAGLWLFSRSPVAPEADLAAMQSVLKAEGIATSQLNTVAQEGCKYDGAYIKH